MRAFKASAVSALLALGLAIPALAQAEASTNARLWPPASCAPQENSVVCSLKIERNESEDQLAITTGAKVELERKAEATAKYWARWVAGDLAAAHERLARSAPHKGAGGPFSHLLRSFFRATTGK